ncbi:MAG: hypothetical protein O3C10_12080 [Chloroflexi bacterium]|nr:hypothetical protein [Chloroflexota bacterium]
MEDVAEIAGFEADFQEQAILYEAFFDVIAERPWIDGALMGTFDWLDQYTRDPAELYFDQTTGASARSKPAEEVIQLWFDGGRPPLTCSNMPRANGPQGALARESFCQNFAPPHIDPGETTSPPPDHRRQRTDRPLSENM